MKSKNTLPSAIKTLPRNFILKALNTRHSGGIRSFKDRRFRRMNKNSWRNEE